MKSLEYEVAHLAISYFLSIALVEKLTLCPARKSNPESKGKKRSLICSCFVMMVNFKDFGLCSVPVQANKINQICIILRKNI